MMKKITDFKEVSPLVLKYFKRGVVTNNFLTPADYRTEIAEGRLFYREDDLLLRLFVKRDDFYIMYFYALDGRTVFPEVDGKIISEASGAAAELLPENGFSEYLERVRLERAATEAVGAESAASSVVKAEKADAVQCFMLLEKSFDRYSAWLPNLTMLEKECEEGFVYIVKAEGEVAAVLRVGTIGQNMQIKHLAADWKFRGRGYAKSLLSAFLSEYSDKKITVRTGSENKAAIGLYKAMGFTETADRSTVYMKG